MALKRHGVVKRIDTIEFAFVDEAREEITDARAIRHLEEARRLTTQDRVLQRAFDEGAVERRAGDLQEAGQLRPVRDEVLDRVAGAGVRSDEPLREARRASRGRLVHQYGDARSIASTSRDLPQFGHVHWLLPMEGLTQI
jgi:hypothetical protein